MSNDDTILLDWAKEMVLTVVKLEAGSGVPGAAWATSNEKLLQDHMPLVCACIVQRFKLIRDTPHETVKKMTAKELVQAGLTDVVRLFVKQEPHKVTKLAEGRVRLIMSCSIIDQVVERMLHSIQNDAEINNWHSIPSKPGIGFTDYIQKKAVVDYILQQAKGKSFAYTDISGWDWSVKLWQLLDDAERRAMLKDCTDEERKVYRNACLNRAFCVGFSVFCLSDGRLIEQIDKGVQLSGCYTTSSTNSFMRIELALLVGALWAAAMGDDDVEDYVDNAVGKYKALGFTIKEGDYVKSENYFEFCSHGFWTENGKYFSKYVGWKKSFFNLLQHDKVNRDDMFTFLQQFKVEMEGDLDIYNKCLDLLHTVGWNQQNFDV